MILPRMILSLHLRGFAGTGASCQRIFFGSRERRGPTASGSNEPDDGECDSGQIRPKRATPGTGPSGQRSFQRPRGLRTNDHDDGAAVIHASHTARSHPPLPSIVLFVRTVRPRPVRRWATIAHPADGHLTARRKRRQSFFAVDLDAGHSGQAGPSPGWLGFARGAARFFCGSGNAIAGRSDRSRAALGTGRSANGILFGSGYGAGNRTRHARRTSPAMENATADRSGRSERRREPWRLANGAISGPGVCGRTIAVSRRGRLTFPLPSSLIPARLHGFVRGETTLRHHRRRFRNAG